MKKVKAGTTGNKIITGSRTRMIAYCGIFFVIFIWGLYPILTSDLLTFYSGGMFTFISSLVSAAALLLICVPKLKLLDRFYFKVAVPTGFFVGLANLLQKMGLQYTTPTQYAFLENLSCVVVPVLLFLFIRKKPGLLTVMASVLCLAGCFVLSGLYLSGGGASFGRGEILCALAGVMYGANIAATGVYAKKMNAMLYVMIQMWVNVLVSGVIAAAFDRIEINGSPIESIVFSWNWKYLLEIAILVLSISTFGWIVRTEALKYVNASVVAVLMPFSAVVTGVVAVCVGKDVFTLHLFFGGLIILLSSILSGLADIKENDRKNDLLKERSDGDNGGGNG